jgi:16S rRNA (guanine966-N2)-methyltransferase
VRITGGTFRSRTLVAPRGAATRPTSDRVREALFSILGSLGAVSGARVLDLYAGTGALALEALSRGAAHATLVESSRASLAAIRSNVEALGVADRTRVLAATAERALDILATDIPKGERFELVFADPPYAGVEGAVRTLERYAGKGAWSPGAVVVLEHSSKDAPEATGLERLELRRYGDTALSLFRA